MNKDLNIVAKVSVSIIGQMVGEYINIDFSMPRYSDLMTYYNATDAKIKLNKFIKKFDRIDNITITLTDGKDNIVLDKLFNFNYELYILEWNAIDKIRENEISLTNNEANIKQMYALLNKFLIKAFDEMDTIYISCLHEKMESLNKI